MPSAMNPNAGMSEQEQQMVKAVCHVPSAHKTPDEGAQDTTERRLTTDRCKWAWSHV
jgi:hypothetical protein